MSLEPNLAALVAASTQLTKSITMPLSDVNGKRDAATTAQADITAAETAIAAASATATTDAATTASKLSAAAADYAAQKTTKGLAAVQTSADSELKDRLHRRDPARHPFRGARPSLVMDFVRQECHRNNAAGNLEPVDLNSFMTFTRASTATVVGPDGLIKEVASNVPRYGYDPVTGEALGLLIEEQRANLLSGSVERLYLWELDRVDPIRSTILSPGGKLDAFKLTERQVSPAPEYYMRSMSGTSGSAGQTFCASVYVHTSSDRVPRLRVTHINCASQTTEASFNISLRTFSSQSGYITSTGFADAGNGWIRIWVVYTLPKESVTEWGLNLQGGTTTGDGISGVVMYGPQLEIGSFPTSYIPTPATFTGRASTKTYFDSNGVLQTAASDVAVTDYGYVDGRWVSKGLSLEPQATNLLTSLANNNATNATKVLNAATAPDGTVSAIKIIPSTTNSVAHYISASAAVTSGNLYTLSVFAAAAEYSVMTVVMTNNGFGINIFGTFDLSAGVCALTNEGVSAGARISMQKFGNFWRCSISAPCTNTYASVNLQFRPISAYTFGDVQTPGDGVSGLYLWGAQLETGPVATSYIPTTTAQVTRAADTSTSAQVTRGADWAASTAAAGLYMKDGGTTCARALQSKNGSYPALYGWAGDVFLFRDFVSNQMFANGRGSNGAAAVGPCVNHGSPMSIATKTSRTKVQSSYNGAGIITSNLSLPTTSVITGIKLGHGGDMWNSHIRSITYFPRQLSDADLQALTILED